MRDAKFELDSFLQDVIKSEPEYRFDKFFSIGYLEHSTIKKKSDYYYTRIGSRYNKKKQLLVVEIRFTPKEKIKYNIILRNKSHIRYNDERFNVIGDREYKKLLYLLERCEITKDKCEKFANGSTSSKSINKFNL